MKYRTMGKLGIRTSAFGLGCMRFNGTASGDSTIDERKAVSLIRRAIDGGVTYLDTAYVYLGKTSETVLGKALWNGYRERVMIATKMPAEHVHDRKEMQALLDKWGLDQDYTPLVFVCLGYIKGEYPKVKARNEGRAIFIGEGECYVGNQLQGSAHQSHDDVRG